MGFFAGKALEKQRQSIGKATKKEARKPLLENYTHRAF